MRKGTQLLCVILDALNLPRGERASSARADYSGLVRSPEETTGSHLAAGSEKFIVQTRDRIEQLWKKPEPTYGIQGYKRTRVRCAFAGKANALPPTLVV